MKKEMSPERKKYLYEYRKEHLRRVTIDMSPEMYEQVKAAAAQSGKPVNTFIKWLLDMYLKHQKT